MLLLSDLVERSEVGHKPHPVLLRFPRALAREEARAETDLVVLQVTARFERRALQQKKEDGEGGRGVPTQH